MEDLQAAVDDRNVVLESVGVAGVRLPIDVRTREGGFRSVTAEVDLTVEVPADRRGTHLSRFVEALHDWTDSPVSMVEIDGLLNDVVRRTGSSAADVDIRFRYFMRKSAPVSELSGMVDYGCGFHGHHVEGSTLFAISVEVPITTLCPCSKSISDYGAHNQRSSVRVDIRCADGELIWLEDVIALVENEASCPVYSLLKRVDEKWVTERAYDNPKFVEDVTRDVSIAVERLDGVRAYRVRTESSESIHNHSAVAGINWTVPKRSVSVKLEERVTALSSPSAARA